MAVRILLGRFHRGERFDFPVDLRTYETPSQAR